MKRSLGTTGAILTAAIAWIVLVSMVHADGAWTSSDQTAWSVEGNAIIHNGDGAGQSSILRCTVGKWDDYAFGGRFQGPEDGSFGLIIRLRDARNYYRLTVNRDSDGDGSSVRIEKCANGKITLLAKKPWTYKPGKWYAVGFGAVKDCLCAQIEDEVELLARDGAITNGALALASTAKTGVRFDMLNLSRDGQDTVLLPTDLQGSGPPEPTGTPLNGEGITTFVPRPADAPIPDLAIDFESGDTRGWQIIDQEPNARSNWSVRDGSLIQTSNIRTTTDEYISYGGTIALLKDRTWSDFVYVAKLQSTTDDGIGLVFRYTDSGNYYRVMMVTDPAKRGPFVRLDKRVNGRMIVLDTAHIGYDANTWYSIGIICDSDNIAVYMDGEPLLGATDGSHKSGGIGLTCYGNEGARFDEIVVYK